MIRGFQLGIIVFLGLGVISLFEGDKGFCDTFPDKPIKVIVYQAAGSGTDVEARGILPYVQKQLGVSITIENVPGAGGKIGLTRVWKAKPDGYTLVVHTTTQSLMGEILFNPEYRIADFSHVFSWSLTNQVLVVNSENWKTHNEFIKDAKARVLSAGIPGRGTSAHLMGLILVDSLRIKVNWVPFDSGQDAITALAGKHIDFAAVGTTIALPLVKAGKLKPLLVFADGKDMVYPDVSSAREMGYNFAVMPMIRGVDGPPQIPMPVIKVLEDAFAKAIKDPHYVTWAQNRMIEIAPLNHKEYQKAIEEQMREIEKYKDILKASQ
jgi:tripartite-type tricarboxylate transporter receptor subunit TctC